MLSIRLTFKSPIVMGRLSLLLVNVYLALHFGSSIHLIDLIQVSLEEYTCYVSVPVYCTFFNQYLMLLWVLYRYNFHLFPRDELQLGMPSYSFSCQSSYFSSMARDGFDFNTCIYDGESLRHAPKENSFLVI